MSIQTARLTAEGSLLVVASGVRVTIDPSLRSANSEVLSPNLVTCSDGFLYLGPNGDGTFDVQNITDAAQQLQWTAAWLHTIQFNHSQIPQTTIGPNGQNPSAQAPVALGSGSTGYDDSLLPQYGFSTVQGALDANKKDIRTLFFRPTLPPSTPPAPDTFTVWSDLYAAYQTIAGAVQIQFEWNPAAPAALTIPAGVWEFSYKDSFCGTGCTIGFPTQVYLADGCLLRNAYHCSGSLFWVGQTTAAPQLEWDELGLLIGQEVVTFQNSSGMANEGSAPMIVWAKDTAVDGFLLLGLDTASRLERRAAPIIEILPGPGATLSQILVYALTASSVEADIVTGAGNVNFATLLQSDSAQVSTDQSGYAGIVSLSSPAAYGNQTNLRVRYNQNDTPPVAGAYAASEGEFVRCRPDGSLVAIDVNLPLAARFPCTVISVKRDNADVATAINVNAQGGELIDGAATFVLPLTARACVTVVSDGAQWMIQSLYG